MPEVELFSDLASKLFYNILKISSIKFNHRLQNISEATFTASRQAKGSGNERVN
ncbi:hypothetical protein [Pontibacter actiniarum]|uniref:hypothetical protein n=1 Tax=Pontibacter actiniarum TaxID=323450 RepID=UPI00146FA2B6|nr:hypothetical protein [Pontibacter actiniarum]